MHDGTYYGHIVRGHGDDVTFDEIRQAVENPTIIVADEKNDMREIYYARGVVEWAGSSMFLKVVAECVSDHSVVITAYVTDRPKPKERVIWPIEP